MKRADGEFGPFGGTRSVDSLRYLSHPWLLCIRACRFCRGGTHVRPNLSVTDGEVVTQVLSQPVCHASTRKQVIEFSVIREYDNLAFCKCARRQVAACTMPKFAFGRGAAHKRECRVADGRVECAGGFAPARAQNRSLQLFTAAQRVRVCVSKFLLAAHTGAPLRAIVPVPIACHLTGRNRYDARAANSA